MKNYPYGYVYEIVNTVNGKTYVGSRKLSRDKSWRHYMGSGKLVKQAIRKYGIDSFRKRFLGYAMNSEDLYNLESKWITHQKKQNLAQYNLFANGHAGGDTFSKLKTKTLEDVRRKQSEGVKESLLHNAAMQAIKDRNEAKNVLLLSEHTESIIDTYSKLKHIGKTSTALKLPVKIVTRALKESGVELNSQNKSGRTMPREQREAIRRGVTAYVNSEEGMTKISQQNYIRNAPSKFKKKFLGLLKRREAFLEQIEKRQKFLDLYLIERYRSKELESALDLKFRSIYYLFEDFGLPRYSARDKATKQELLALHRVASERLSRATISKDNRKPILPIS